MFKNNSNKSNQIEIHYKKTDDLIDQSILAEQVMQYANRYVGNAPEIDVALAKAKEFFDHKFRYADSLAYHCKCG